MPYGDPAFRRSKAGRLRGEGVRMVRREVCGGGGFAFGRRDSFTPEQIRSIGRFRKSVFVDGLGWDLSVLDGCEFDEFDRADVLYLLAEGREGEVKAFARLMPTTEGYLLKKFSHLWPKCAFLEGEGVWEVSRFAALPDKEDASSGVDLVCVPSKTFMNKVVHASWSMGVSSLVSMSSVNMERFLRINRVSSRRMADPVSYRGDMVVPLVIDVVPGF